MALGSVCSSCLRDPSGYRAHHGAILGQGTLIWGHAAALQRGSTDFAAFPLPPSKSPFPSHPHPCSPGWLSRTIPERLFSFLCLIFPLFPSNRLPREEQLPRGDPPPEQLTWTSRGCGRWFDAALGISPCPASRCRSTGWHKANRKIICGISVL